MATWIAIVHSYRGYIAWKSGIEKGGGKVYLANRGDGRWKQALTVSNSVWQRLPEFVRAAAVVDGRSEGGESASGPRLLPQLLERGNVLEPPDGSIDSWLPDVPRHITVLDLRYSTVLTVEDVQTLLDAERFERIWISEDRFGQRLVARWKADEPRLLFAD